MSVSRMTARLIAAFVASGALIGAAAMPAMAAGHDRDNGRSYHHIRIDRDHDGHRGRVADRDHRHHGWYNIRHWGRDHGRQHGWYGDRHRDRDHYHGRR